MVGRLENCRCVDLRTNDAEWDRGMFSQSLLNSVIFIYSSRVSLKEAGSQSNPRLACDQPLNLSISFNSIVYVDFSAITGRLYTPLQDKVNLMIPQFSTRSEQSPIG